MDRGKIGVRKTIAAFFGVVLGLAFGCQASSPGSPEDESAGGEGASAGASGSAAGGSTTAVSGSAGTGSIGGGPSATGGATGSSSASAGASGSSSSSAGTAGATGASASSSATQGGTTGSSTCAAGATLCGTVCVPTQTDENNCGACSKACGAGEQCQNGSCQCQIGLVSCGGACVDTNSSPANCGGCDKPCPTGQVCSGGRCAAGCAAGEYLCGQACVDLASSIEHCGDCATSCTGGRACNGGVCTCPSGQLYCSGQCVATASNPNNCGNCGVTCKGGQSCANGKCVCPSGQTFCPNTSTCADLNTSNANCGSCDATCGGGGTCAGGKCTCPAGKTYCGAACVDVATDPANCGKCDNQCLIGATCSGGACKNGGGGAGQIFPTCRFHFGEDYGSFKAHPQAEVEYVTSWAGSADTFNLGEMFTACKAGGVAAGRLPVVYGYIIAFLARRDQNLQDCNTTTGASLCTGGAAYIRAHFNDRILPIYQTYARGIQSSWGTTNPVIWLMEPDYYQYASDSRQSGGPLTFQQAGDYMHQIVSAVRAILPNAIFSMDISPWMSASTLTQWLAAFQMSDFTFMNTSGGATLANSANIRANQLTWAQVYDATQKPIIADASYCGGTGCDSQQHDANWDAVANLNARISNGVVAVTHVNVPDNWSSTITSLRPQLGTPVQCP